MHKSLLFIAALLCLTNGMAQQAIALDTTTWDINARSYVLESFKGKDAIYLQGGTMTLKDQNFLNGTIEYDIYLKEEQAFPGVYFRINESNAEHFYIRPHQSGNPDANQAIPVTNGISPWQLYYGPRYAFPYPYKYDDWTHVKLVVEGSKAQVYLDHAETPNLSWDLFHEAKEGQIALSGGNANALHIANIVVDPDKHTLVDFNPIAREPIAGLVREWAISDKFEEKLLDDPEGMAALIAARKWTDKVQVEEGTAANISRKVQLLDGQPGNTVLAKVEIDSDRAQLKHFEFGYSDRVVVVLNGKPIYRGMNNYRSRDYRYLGTIGLFDGVYLDLKAGKNTLVMAVSEDFGGWLITGRFADPEGVRVE